MQKQNNVKTVDEEIIEETNFLLFELQQDIIAINEVTLIINEHLVIDGEKLDKIEHNIMETNNTISEIIPLLEDINKSNDTFNTLTIIGGSIVGGALCGGIGAIFGVVHAVVGIGVGLSGGATVGYLTNLF